jgi:hypothetical protein
MPFRGPVIAEALRVHPKATPHDSLHSHRKAHISSIFDAQAKGSSSAGSLLRTFPTRSLTGQANISSAG